MMALRSPALAMSTQSQEDLLYRSRFPTTPRTRLKVIFEFSALDRLYTPIETVGEISASIVFGQELTLPIPGTGFVFGIITAETTVLLPDTPVPRS